jgi:hypothetical protein
VRLLMGNRKPDDVGKDHNYHYRIHQQVNLKIVFIF